MSKANTVKTVKGKTARFNRTNLFKQFFAAPFIIFMLFFAVLPIALLFVNAFVGTDGRFTLRWLFNFFTNTDTLRIFMRSLLIALTTTAICLAIAYPTAYILSMTKIKRAPMIIILFIMPMWINSMLRVYAMKLLFQLFTNRMTDVTLLIGLVNDFLPFCILPLYTVLSKMDKSYMEAAQDLGASPPQVFFKTVLPLSVSGVISASLMVFMPTVSTFYMNEFLGPTENRLFGQVISDLFKGGLSMKSQGSMYALIMLVIIALSVLVTNKFSKVGNARGGLW